MKTDRHGKAKILTEAEIKKLFTDGLKTDRDRALFGFCLYTACRISEACSLLTTDIYKDGVVIESKEVLTIRRENTKKKMGTRQIDLHPKLKKLLENYVPGDKNVFPGRWGRGYINPASADEILREACDRIGLVGVSTHSFRRTALTTMSNAGIPLRHIMEISGHSDLATLQEYLDVTPENKKSAVNALKF
jgi:integrase/recombinase XerD